MFKKLMIIVIAALMALVMAMPAMAEHFTGGSDWSVTFTTDKKMDSNFTKDAMSDTLKNLQPGDDATFTVTINNSYDGKINWYMSNKVIESLEDASNNSTTAGGAYTYRLVYTDNAGQQTTLYDSDKVGGEMTEEEIEEVGGEGLHEATSALEDYFLLDSMTRGNKGVVELYVALDGETQNNNYQDTLAALQMNFAVEVEDEIQTTTPPKTGDTNNSFIYFVIIGVAGVLLLAAAILRVIAGRKREEK